MRAEIDGDTFFPEIDDEQWRLADSEAHDADDVNQFAYEFRTYERRDRS